MTKFKTIQNHADLYKTGCSSLLDKDCFYKSIWREAIYEQKKSLAEAILRIGSESEPQFQLQRKDHYV